MSIGGMLATALAGGAQVVGKQAGDDIDAGRKTDLMREQAAIQQQMEERLIEARARSARDQNMNLRTDNRAFDSSDDTIAASDKVAQAAGKTARGVKLAELTDTGLNEAGRSKTAADAKSASETARQTTKDAAADTGYLASLKTVALANPEVAAHIAQMKDAANASNAAAGNSAAHSGLLSAQTVGVKLGNEDKKMLSGIYTGMDTALTDPKLSDDERAKKLKELEKRAAMIQGRSGKNAGTRDPELNTTTTETTKILPDGTQVKSTSKEVRKPGAAEVDPYAVPKRGEKAATDPYAKLAVKPSLISSADAGSHGIQFVKTGYGTGFYRYSGKNYPTLAEAQNDKKQFDDTPAEEIFKQSN